MCQHVLKDFKCECFKINWCFPGMFMWVILVIVHLNHLNPTWILLRSWHFCQTSPCQILETGSISEWGCLINWIASKTAAAWVTCTSLKLGSSCKTVLIAYGTRNSASTSGAGKLHLTPHVRRVACNDITISPCTTFVQNCIYFAGFWS